MRRKEMQGDARRRKYPAIEALSKWLGPARGRAITERASERRTSPGRALEKRGITALEKPRRKKSVPVVPVVPVFQYSSIPINFETPPFFSYYL